MKGGKEGREGIVSPSPAPCFKILKPPLFFTILCPFFIYLRFVCKYIAGLAVDCVVCASP